MNATKGHPHEPLTAIPAEEIDHAKLKALFENAKKLDRRVTAMVVLIYFALGMILALTFWG